jgi:putative transposase
VAHRRYCYLNSFGKVKGASSHDINAARMIATRFAWGEGYGVLSLAKRNVAAVRNYIAKQREHHSSGTSIAKMERVEPDDIG